MGRLLGAFAAAWAMLLSTGQAASQTAYPTRPIEIVVPFPAGGGTDLLARLLADGLTPRLGQRVLVVNRTGANTIVGTQAVIRAAPDGYTLLLSSIGLAANPHLYKPVPFDPEKQLSPIVLVANSPSILVVTGSAPVSSVAELIALLKAKPGDQAYASYGNGSAPHLSTELFLAMTGTRMLHVPYGGGAPAVTALAGGHVNALFAGGSAVTGMIGSGKIKPIAIASAARLASLPNVPTFREGGVDLITGTWFGMLAPAGTPRAIIDKLNAESVAVLREPAVTKRIVGESSEVGAGTPEDFGRFIAAERRRLSGVIEKAGIKVGE
jgi:tripartite-type tricarboxylate transporter receptor subunit TctC